MQDLLKHLGQRIRELRSERGWSQEQFADVCGVHRTYMGHLERGEKNVSFSTLLRVSDALSVTLAELFRGLEGRESESTSVNPPPAQQRGRRGQSGVIDRSRLARELAAMERAIRNLREITTLQPEPSASQLRRKIGKKRGR